MDKESNLPNELPDLLSAVLHDSLTEQQAEKLAAVCINLAISYMTVFRSRGYRFLLQRFPYAEKGLAADCVADLFITTADAAYPFLKRFLSHYPQEIKSASGCYLVLRRLIGHRMQQHLRRCFYEHDAENAKLYRNLRLAVRRIKGATVQTSLAGLQIMYPIASHDSGYKKPSLRQLERLAWNNFTSKMKINELVEKILHKAHVLFGQPIVIDFTDLYYLIRTFRATQETEQTIYAPPCEFPAQWQELQRCVDDRLLEIRDTVLLRYVRENKLTVCESTALFAALNDLARDLVLGETAETNYSYVRRYWPSLPEEAYYSSLRKIFEYLVRLLKVHLAEAVKIFF